MELNDWILALHVLSAFALVAGLVLFWILIVSGWNADTPARTLLVGPLARTGTVAVSVGAGGTLVFGVWLAFAKGSYAIWDAWIIGALVLWAIGGWLGGQTGAEYTRVMKRAEELAAAGSDVPSAELVALNRTRRGLVLHALTSLAFMLVLVDMVWKPGA